MSPRPAAAGTVGLPSCPPRAPRLDLSALWLALAADEPPTGPRSPGGSGPDDEALAQDITSDTFIKAMRGIESFRWQGKDIAAWFVTIARNLVNDHAKSSRFRMEVTTADMLDADQSVDAPDGEVLDRLRDARLLEAVKSLKPEQQECITLRFLDGLSLAETAVVMGKKENAVKQLQLRAVRALQRALEGEDLR